MFCQHQSQKLGRAIAGASSRALDIMTAYDWPGNVCELQNVIERAAIVCEDEIIDEQHLLVSLGDSRPGRIALSESDVNFDEEMENFERRPILHVYESCDRVKAQTAKKLGIDRNRLRYKLKKYGIDD